MNKNNKGESMVARLMKPKEAKKYSEDFGLSVEPLINLAYRSKNPENREDDKILVCVHLIFSTSEMVKALPKKLCSLPDYESNPGFWIIDLPNINEVLFYYNDGWKKSAYKGGQLCWLFKEEDEFGVKIEKSFSERKNLLVSEFKKGMMEVFNDNFWDNVLSEGGSKIELIDQIMDGKFKITPIKCVEWEKQKKTKKIKAKV